MDRATRGSRRIFLSFTRPRAELIRTCLPSKSTQTGVTCGLPSELRVLRLAKAFFLNRSLYLSGTCVGMGSLQRFACGANSENVPLRAGECDPAPGFSFRQNHISAGWHHEDA